MSVRLALGVSCARRKDIVRKPGFVFGQMTRALSGVNSHDTGSQVGPAPASAASRRPVAAAGSSNQAHLLDALKRVHRAVITLHDEATFAVKIGDDAFNGRSIHEGADSFSEEKAPLLCLREGVLKSAPGDSS